MHLTNHVAGRRLRRLKQRAFASARIESLEEVQFTPVTQLSPRIEPPAPAAEVDEDEALALDRRGSPRRDLRSSELIVRRIGGFNFQVGLRDMSMGGCRIELIEEFQAGEDVITRFPQLEPLGAWVRWTIGTVAGIEFMRPIHPAVFKALLTRLVGDQPAAA